MNRRDFVRVGMFSGLLTSIPLEMSLAQEKKQPIRHEFASDVVIIGGGLGGCAAALAILRNGKYVVLTEETDWIGGQLTAQGVPPDEHNWIESFGATQFYRNFRTAIRNYYVRNYPLTDAARTRKNLNPGDGDVSKLCHEPRVALAVLYELFQPYLSSGKVIPRIVREKAHLLTEFQEFIRTQGIETHWND
jgi:hypothetical protein